jgi:hypothetical protein
VAPVQLRRQILLIRLGFRTRGTALINRTKKTRHAVVIGVLKVHTRLIPIYIYLDLSWAGNGRGQGRVAILTPALHHGSLLNPLLVAREESPYIARLRLRGSERAIHAHTAPLRPVGLWARWPLRPVPAYRLQNLHISTVKKG